MQSTENKEVISEIVKICKNLGLEVDTKVPSEKNKFLSAWHKGSAVPTN